LSTVLIGEAIQLSKILSRRRIFSIQLLHQCGIVIQHPIIPGTQELALFAQTYYFHHYVHLLLFSLGKLLINFLLLTQHLLPLSFAVEPFGTFPTPTSAFGTVTVLGIRHTGDAVGKAMFTRVFSN
jgi:hypothetical protein